MQLIRNITVKQKVNFIVVIFSLFSFLVLTIWSEIQINNLSDQQGAARWDQEGDAAQVSCFFAEGVEADEYQIISFQQKLKQQLLEVLPQEETGTENSKRLFVDTYSASGTITVTSEKGKLEGVNAVGIGGDFFFFHPLQLISGQYFSGNDLMKDSVILDEDAAWQLFGSNDIAGKSVMIGDVPHYIAGVVKRQEGKFAESAGLSETIVYVSYETLNAYGRADEISCYEVIAPNPVKNFVYTAVKEKMGIEEEDMVVVENSSRYDLENLISVILDFGTRSMQHQAVRFPYWENMARGWEDVKALTLIFQFFFLLIPAMMILICLIKKWRNRKFTWKDIGSFWMEQKEQWVQKAKRKKAEK